MSLEIPRQNGKNWLVKNLVWIIMVLVLMIYSGFVTTQKSNDLTAIKEIQSTVNINSGKILRLETLMENLRTVPESLAGLKATMDAVKQTVDDTKKKVDSHVEQR